MQIIIGTDSFTNVIPPCQVGSMISFPHHFAHHTGMGDIAAKGKCLQLALRTMGFDLFRDKFTMLIIGHLCD